MHIERTPFEGMFIITPKIFRDDRGYFFETWNNHTAHTLGLDFQFAQDNQSLSNKGVLRGLHFQVPPFEQGKLVRVVTGSVLDVAVDLRREQPTYKKHFKIVLNDHTCQMLFIPAGFAHGFLTLQDNTIFAYKCTQVYNSECDRVLYYNDPAFKIDWGIENPILSDKDRLAPCLDPDNNPFQ